MIGSCEELVGKICLFLFFWRAPQDSGQQGMVKTPSLMRGIFFRCYLAGHFGWAILSLQLHPGDFFFLHSLWFVPSHGHWNSKPPRGCWMQSKSMLRPLSLLQRSRIVIWLLGKRKKPGIQLKCRDWETSWRLKGKSIRQSQRCDPRPSSLLTVAFVFCEPYSGPGEPCLESDWIVRPVVEELLQLLRP